MNLITAADGTRVYVYGDSKECPSKRYSRLQKYLVMDAGIGSDLESISSHFTRLYGFIGEAMTDTALKECENLHMNFFAVLNEMNFRSLAFAIIVASINDEPQTDISDEGLKRLLERVDSLELSQGTIETAVDEVKKKIGEELKLYFPRLFPDDSVEFYQKLKQRIMLQGQMLIDPDGGTPEMIASMKEINRFFLLQNLPQSFRPDDVDNATVVLEKSFSQLVSVLGNNGAPNAQELTVFDFYGHLDYLSKPQQK